MSPMMLIQTIISICFFGAAMGRKVVAKKNYVIYCDGNCANDVTPTSTQPGVVLMGGGVCFNELLEEKLKKIISSIF